MFQSVTDGYKSTKYKPQKLKKKKKKKKKNFDECSIDETVVKADSELIWLWITIIELTKYREILSINISKEQKNMFIVVAEHFLSSVVN